jgi:hypothetical protein
MPYALSIIHPSPVTEFRCRLKYNCAQETIISSANFNVAEPLGAGFSGTS